MGLDYALVWSMPFGELCDLVTIHRIKTEGAKPKKVVDEEAEFWKLMERE